MSIINKYLSLNVWSASELVAWALATLILLTLAEVGSFMSWPGAIAGAAGAFVLRHFALHGWTLLRGTIAQRLLLTSLWIGAILIGGLATALLGL